MEIFLHTRLKLMEGMADAQIKSRVLNEEFIMDVIEEHLQDCSFTFLLVCLMVLSSVSHPTKERYVGFIERRFQILFENACNGRDSIGIITLGTGFRALARNAPSSLVVVQETYGAVRFLRLIIANGTLIELFRILHYATPVFREDLLGLLDEAKAAALVGKTINARRSIGTLSLVLRELNNTDKDLLERLEQTIGAGPFLRLIVTNGTLVELFSILQHTTPTFREALLVLLNEANVGKLVDKTIANGRSIGTLNLVLRELNNTDKDLLERLEQTIGAGPFLRLIVANGTLVELFSILQHTTPTFREALLVLLNEANVGKLVDKTIANGRSIGTLDFVLRELNNTDKDLLERLEQTIRAGPFLRLIVANGTLYELFNILQHTTPTFCAALLNLLDKAKTGLLVDKTIAAGRSIGTIHLTLRELGNTNKDLLGRLEKIIGAERFLRLIAANGTLLELLQILQYTTPTFRDVLLGLLDKASVGELIDKTIAEGRSIESIHHSLRQLRQQPGQLEWFEELLGLDGWWRLFIGVGTLNSVIQTTHEMSVEFRRALVEASSDLSIADWRGIIESGLFLNTCTFSSEELAVYPEPSRIVFQEALRETAAPLAAKATWFDLNPSRPPTDPNSPERQILLAALQPRIEGLKQEDLLGLDFLEAVNGLAFAWRERPDLRLALAPRLCEILPVPADWPYEEGKVASLRLVLVIARSELVASRRCSSTFIGNPQVPEPFGVHRNSHTSSFPSSMEHVRRPLRTLGRTLPLFQGGLARFIDSNPNGGITGAGGPERID